MDYGVDLYTENSTKNEEVKLFQGAVNSFILFPMIVVVLAAHRRQTINTSWCLTPSWMYICGVEWHSAPDNSDHHPDESALCILAGRLVRDSRKHRAIGMTNLVCYMSVQMTAII